MKKLLDKRIVQRQSLRLLVASLTALTVSGCALVPTANEDVRADGNAGAGQTPGQVPCYDLTLHWDTFGPQTIAVQASIFASIFVGTFGGKDSAFWNTPDGLPPESTGAFGTANIYTPIAINLDRVIRGQAADPGRTTLEGGSIGCSKLVLRPSLELQQGVRYLFFSTGRGQDSTGGPMGFIVVSLAWPVSDGDLVETPEEGTLPLADVIRQIEAHPLLEPGESLPSPTKDPNAPPEMPPTDDSSP